MIPPSPAARESESSASSPLPLISGLPVRGVRRRAKVWHLAGTPSVTVGGPWASDCGPASDRFFLFLSLVGKQQVHCLLPLHVKGYSFFLKVKRLQQNLHGVQKFPENQGKKGKTENCSPHFGFTYRLVIYVMSLFIVECLILNYACYLCCCLRFVVKSSSTTLFSQ